MTLEDSMGIPAFSHTWEGITEIFNRNSEVYITLQNRNSIWRISEQNTNKLWLHRNQHCKSNGPKDEITSRAMWMCN